MRKLISIALAIVAAAFISATAFAAIVLDRRDPGPAANTETSRSDDIQANCTVGGIPTLKHLDNLPGRGKFLIRPTIVGCGKSFEESIQLVATYTTKGFCFSIDRPRHGSSGGGECKASNISWHEACANLCIYSVLSTDLGYKGRMRRTMVSGQAPLAASLVEIKTAVGGEQLKTTAVLGRVEDPSLMEKVHQTEPFLLFGSVLPRCVPARSVRVIAKDETGDVIASRQGRNVLANHCYAPPLPKPPVDNS
jgi:hypothetical protein